MDLIENVLAKIFGQFSQNKCAFKVSELHTPQFVFNKLILIQMTLDIFGDNCLLERQFCQDSRTINLLNLF